jgi:HD-like signal output (HDOD) protein
MQLSPRLKNCLAQSAGRWLGRAVRSDIPLPAAIAEAALPAAACARGWLVQSGQSRFIVITRCDHRPDLDRLQQMLQRSAPLSLCSEGLELEGIDPAWLPPLPAAWGVKGVIDSQLLQQPRLYLTSGIPGLLLHSDAATVALIYSNLPARHGIGQPLDIATPVTHISTPQQRFRQRIEGIDQLPAMPGFASTLIRLRQNPYANASELAQLIEQDPLMSAQILRFARSPLYGYGDRIQGVERAIVQVLGMDLAFDMTLGLALGRAFNHSRHGPIGLDAVWRHALYTATLAQRLAQAIDFSIRPSASLAYLCGLLHNVGFLLLGLLFGESFDRLNRALAEADHPPLAQLERRFIGVSHSDLGLWLMESWGMPQELMVTIREHHQPAYSGDYHLYANLVTLANQLLARFAIGDETQVALDEALLSRLGLDYAQAELALAQVMDQQSLLNEAVEQMVA